MRERDKSFRSPQRWSAAATPKERELRTMVIWRTEKRVTSEVRPSLHSQLVKELKVLHKLKTQELILARSVSSPLRAFIVCSTRMSP
ncbi:hypothetical protein HanPI659440_Chr04g0140781 [Helianthus annuus]|nr:hypothetical protein HanPI659440_Chr04g0140781 [Helianthus annuus]